MPPDADRANSAVDAARPDRHTAQPILRTERLRLVPLADEHLDLEIELDSDPAVMRYLTGRAASRTEAEQAHRRRIAAAHELPGLGFWAGFAGEEFIGWWLLRPPNGPDQPKVAGEAELGYRVLRRHWRRGYAGEGGRELIRYGFQDMRLNRIFAQTLAVNHPSRATMTAVGLSFARAFISDEPYDATVPGADQGEVEYEISRTTWRHQRGCGDGAVGAAPGQGSADGPVNAPRGSGGRRLSS